MLQRRVSSSGWARANAWVVLAVMLLLPATSYALEPGFEVRGGPSFSFTNTRAGECDSTQVNIGHAAGTLSLRKSVQGRVHLDTELGLDVAHRMLSFQSNLVCSPDGIDGHSIFRRSYTSLRLGASLPLFTFGEDGTASLTIGAGPLVGVRSSYYVDFDGYQNGSTPQENVVSPVGMFKPYLGIDSRLGVQAVGRNVGYSFGFSAQLQQHAWWVEETSPPRWHVGNRHNVGAYFELVWVNKPVGELPAER